MGAYPGEIQVGEPAWVGRVRVAIRPIRKYRALTPPETGEGEVPIWRPVTAGDRPLPPEGETVKPHQTPDIGLEARPIPDRHRVGDRPDGEAAPSESVALPGSITKGVAARGV